MGLGNQLVLKISVSVIFFRYSLINQCIFDHLLYFHYLFIPTITIIPFFKSNIQAYLLSTSTVLFSIPLRSIISTLILQLYQSSNNKHVQACRWTVPSTEQAHKLDRQVSTASLHLLLLPLPLNCSLMPSTCANAKLSFPTLKVIWQVCWLFYPFYIPPEVYTHITLMERIAEPLVRVHSHADWFGWH